MKTKIVHVVQYHSPIRFGGMKGIDSDSPEPSGLLEKLNADPYLEEGESVSHVRSFRRPVNYFDWADAGFAEMPV